MLDFTVNYVCSHALMGLDAVQILRGGKEGVRGLSKALRSTAVGCTWGQVSPKMSFLERICNSVENHTLKNVSNSPVDVAFISKE